MGYIHPPETGEYIFAVASDDNSQLWLSTDSSPANAVQVAQESTWVGHRQFQSQGDESTSEPVYLKAGETYFIELIAMEGTGGDNAAVSWSLPSEGPSEVPVNSLPISGDYLSPFVSFNSSNGQNSRSIQKGAFQLINYIDYRTNPFGFSYQTQRNKIYTVEYSSDLRQWLPLQSVKGTGNSIKFVEQRDLSSRQQFYRVKEE